MRKPEQCRDGAGSSAAGRHSLRAHSVSNDSPVRTNLVAPVGQTVHRKCVCSGGTKCPGCKDEESDGHIQRKSSPGAASPRSASNGALASLGCGRALDAGTRGHTESRFGQDFGAVRIHDDARAAESGKSIDARAFTHGHDVAFASGEYAAHSAEGRRLLAHELVHVVQQRSSLDRLG